MNATEDRLRTEMRAESELITRDSIRPLSLDPRDGSQPARAPRRATRRRATRGRNAPGWVRQWPAWVAPAAAAAAVAAVITGTLTISGLVAGGGPGQPAAGGWASYSSLPPYYATTVMGTLASDAKVAVTVLGRQIQVRATGTGKVLATLSPPASYNRYIALTGSEDGRTFVFGAERYFGLRVSGSRQAAMLDTASPVKFTIAHIAPSGQVTQSALTLPFTIMPMQSPSIAMSPDGSRLAVAYGGDGHDAMLRVVTLATGQVSQWAWPHVNWTPMLRQQGAWTADGRTLVLQEEPLDRGPVPPGTTPAAIPPATTIFMINAMAAAGSSDTATRLVLHAPAGMSAPWQPFVTPDGSELVATTKRGPGGPSVIPQSGEFAVYSARTGALTGTEAHWAVSRAAKRPLGAVVVWSSLSGSRLLVLFPRDEEGHLGVLKGGTVRLSGSDLLPRSPAARAALEKALPNSDSSPPSMTW